MVSVTNICSVLIRGIRNPTLVGEAEQCITITNKVINNNGITEVGDNLHGTVAGCATFTDSAPSFPTLCLIFYCFSDKISPGRAHLLHTVRYATIIMFRHAILALLCVWDKYPIYTLYSHIFA